MVDIEAVIDRAGVFVGDIDFGNACSELSTIGDAREKLPLLIDQGSAAAGELYIQPERILFRAYVPAGDRSALLDSWLQDLLSLAGEVERLSTDR